MYCECQRIEADIKCKLYYYSKCVVIQFKEIVNIDNVLVKMTVLLFVNRNNNCIIECIIFLLNFCGGGGLVFRGVQNDEIFVK